MQYNIRFGQPASNQDLVNKTQLINQYYNLNPNPNDNKGHSVVFGTSGHRGTSNQYSFNEAHILAIIQSIVQIRTQYGITGPCYVGKDTHILSEPAFISVLEVLAANSIDIIIQTNNGYTPTPVISYNIVNYNSQRYVYSPSNQADGIIITSSHNPPEYGGIKYNSIFGGPAPTNITDQIEYNANKILKNNLQKVNRITLCHAWRSGYIHTQDLLQNYIQNLSKIINMEAIKVSGLKIGVDPLSGASIEYWQNIAQYYQLDLTIVNEKIDQTFSFMYLDYDGSIRIDCSSELTLTKALKASKNFDIFFVNDPDCDRHGIITSLGLMQPNFYLAIVINYLFHNRPLWNNQALLIGTTNVSSIIINHVANNLNRALLTVPVGFKWFSRGLFSSYLGIAGEDSSGASFLDYNCMPWSTDKDGLIMCLLAAEIIAITDQTLNSYYEYLIKNFNTSNYNRIQIVINHIQKSSILDMLCNKIHITELAGDPVIKTSNIISVFNKNSMDGIKIITSNGWIACRLSGTESIYKIYCESFLGIDHRKKMEQEMIENIYKIFD